LGRHTNEAIVTRLLDGKGQLIDVAVVPEALVRFFRIDKPARTSALGPGAIPEGMVRVPAGSFRYVVRQTQEAWQATYANQWRVYRPAPEFAREARLAGFWIDRYPVTNRQYARFLDEIGYRPKDASSFLKHFVDGRPPAGREEHPVVYVSYEDAKAYAEWAGRRLPTEEEWQYAAGGGSDRSWPWGVGEPDAELCNLFGGGTQPVHSHPRGASPFGAEDMVGNVWQWTASLMHNGRHVVAFLRGGGWYHTPEGRWWVRGGPRPITDHFPLPLFGPGMNRLSTVGFRCAMDE
jgi:formylglycine-generating enzyme required for sulfatase activity